MKRLHLLLMVPIICLFIGGCSSTESPDIPENTCEDLVIKDLQYDKDTRTITFKTQNKGSKDVTTGLYYKIEKYNEENKWEKTNLTDNLAFIQIARIIEPGKTIEESIDLSMVDITEKGEYRIVKEYTIGDEDINQYIQFKVYGSIVDLNTYNSITP